MDAQNAPSPMPANPTVEISNKGSRNIKKIIFALVVIVLLAALGVASFVLVIKPQFLAKKAPDCSTYSFSLDETGKVTVTNSSSQKYPAQQVKINVGSTELATLDVPEVGPNETKTVGIVTVPTGSFSWEATGSVSCKNSGSVEARATPTPLVSARCALISAYDTNWNILSLEDLSKVTAGSTIRFTVLGTSNTGTFDKAKFTINGEERPEVTTKKPDSNEFYDEYIIPKGVTSFTVNAMVHNVELDSWF